MTETNADKVLLSNEHVASGCWNPHYHQEPFRADLAEIFENWYCKQYDKNANQQISYKAVSLCIFSGVSYNKKYIEGVEASGTYAVCPECKKIIMCGYHDEHGLSPKKCDKCSTELSLNCYFQLVEIRHKLLVAGPINPKKDPFVAFAEIASLASGGIPFNLFEDIAYILIAENLITKRGYLYGHLPMTLETNNQLLWFSHRWVNAVSTHAYRNVEVTDEGKAMLLARSITPLPGAKERIKELLAISDQKRTALCLRNQATIIERQ